MADSNASTATMRADAAVTMSSSRPGHTPASFADDARRHASTAPAIVPPRKRDGIATSALLKLMVLPIATLIALAIHAWVPDVGQIQRSNAYPRVLLGVLVVAVLLAGVVQINRSVLRNWLLASLPLMAAG